MTLNARTLLGHCEEISFPNRSCVGAHLRRTSSEMRRAAGSPPYFRELECPSH